MRILITGIHGFVGSNMVEAYKDKHVLYGLDIVAPVKDGVEHTYTWDDMKNGLLPEVDAIIHLAGKAHDTKNASEADVYFAVNTELTKKVFDYFMSSTARKFMFFSSVKAAAEKVEGDVLTEDVTPKPVGPYGESKIKAEEYIKERFSTMDAETKHTKQIYILRPCMIHGPGNKGNLNLLYGVVSKGIPWPLGSFENRRTFTSIDNLTYVVDRMLMNDVPSGVYHMGDDEALSTNELIDVICQALGKKAHIWHLPCGLMSGFAKMGDYLHLPLNTERLRKLTENYVASNAKIKNVLGIAQMPVRAKDGLVKTIVSFEGVNKK